MPNSLYGTVAAWLRHPKAGPRDLPVLVTHPDTLSRCLADGWTVVTLEPPEPPAGADAAQEGATAQYAVSPAEDTPAPTHGVSRTPHAKPVKGGRSHGR